MIVPKPFSMIVVAVASLLALSAGRAQVLPSDPVAPYLASESTSFVLRDARIVDGTGAAPMEGFSLVVADGRIAALGPAGEVAAPEDAHVIDLAGHTILPGLITMHEHIWYGIPPIGIEQGDIVPGAYPDSIAKLLLAAGVTTVREAGAVTPQAMIDFARRIDDGRTVGPTLFTGPFLNGRETAWLGDFAVDTAEEAREVVRFWANRGATVIKAYTGISADALGGAIEEAHRLGIQVTAHLGRVSCSEAARLGIDSIEYALGACGSDLPSYQAGRFLYEDSDVVDASGPEFTRLIEVLIEHDVTLIDTVHSLPTEEMLSMVTAEQRERYEATLASPDPFLARVLDPDEKYWQIGEDYRRRFVAAGGRLLLGTDAPVVGAIHGYATHGAMITRAVPRGGGSRVLQGLC
jgi:hypothetical protein